MPNPFTENVTLNINNTVSGAYSISVFNVEGKLVHFQNNLNQNTVSIGNNLENGLYIVELRGENGWIQRERLVKSNR
jgi:membrane-bound inhibitor of C-type lysozyme